MFETNKQTGMQQRRSANKRFVNFLKENETMFMALSYLPISW